MTLLVKLISIFNMTKQEVLKILKIACNAKGSQRAWAKDNGFSDAYISDVLARKRELSDNVCRSLGFERIVSYRKLNGKL